MDRPENLQRRCSLFESAASLRAIRIEVIRRAGDLDLQTEAGIARLHALIAQAAKSVCGGMSQTFLAETQWRKQCRTLAISDAIARVNQPLLSHYHAQRNLFAAR